MALKKITLGVSFFLTLIIIFFVVYGAFHSWPNVEDLEHSIASRDLNLWRSITNRAITHDGRYATNFLHASNFLVFNKVSWYKYIVLSTIFLLFFSVFGIIKLIFSQSKFLFHLGMSISFVAIIFLVSPSLYYALYGISFSYIYFYPCIVLFFIIALSYKYFTTNSKYHLFLFTLLSFLLFFGIGLSELFLLFYLSLSFMLPLYFGIYDRKFLNKSIPLSLVMIICVLFFVLSPGVPSRMEQSPSLVFIINALKIYIIYLKDYFLTWPVLLIFFYTALFNEKIKIVLTSKIHFWGILFLVFVIPYLMTLPFYFANPDISSLAERIYVPISLIQISILTFIIFPNIWNVVYKKYNKISFDKLNRVIYLFCFVMLFMVVLNIYKGKGSIGLLFVESKTSQISDFNMFMRERYSKLSKASISKDEFKLVCLEELKTYPSTLYCFQDLQNNRRDSKWNRFIEAYFNIDEVRIYGNQINKFEY